MGMRVQSREWEVLSLAEFQRGLSSDTTPEA
jgi:hypothetical protein